MANETYKEFRDRIGFKQYILAHVLGMSENTFSTLLREELPEEVQRCLIQAIKDYVWENPLDLSVWREWIQKNRVRKTRAMFNQRKIDRALDEADMRRQNGGWDMLFSTGPLRDDCKVYYEDIFS